MLAAARAAIPRPAAAHHCGEAACRRAAALSHPRSAGLAAAVAWRRRRQPRASSPPAASAQQQTTTTRLPAAKLEEVVTGAAEVMEESLHHRAQLCDSGLPDPDMCLVDEAEEEPPAHLAVVDEAVTRGRWLLGLLVLQSCSSVVLDSYQDLIRDHLVVTLFLTMLVGAGGNVGNQSAIRVIRGLATGALAPTWPCVCDTLVQQARVGVLLGGALSAAGFVRVYVTNGDALNAAAISLSLAAIVISSTVLGTSIPFALTRAGLDPAHGGTTIQVVMDILGVALTCGICNVMLVQLSSGLLTH